MISIYMSISIFRTLETIAMVNILLQILLLLPLYYHDSTIVKVTIAMHQVGGQVWLRCHVSYVTRASN